MVLLRYVLLIANVVGSVVPSVVRLGALFPMFKTERANFAMDISGIRRFSAFLLALNEINNKTDGIEDYLLPNTRLEYAFCDSKRDDESAFFCALSLAQTVFGGDGTSAIVGAASSGPSSAAALVTARTHVPQISYSSTSALLSNGNQYSYFLRTPPSDAFQAIGQVDLIKNLFQFTHVATVSSTDAYGSAGIAAFHIAAADAGLNILTAQTFAKDANDFSEQYHELKRHHARVIVIFCQASDAGRFMRGAYAQGIGGSGYMWFGSDAVTKSDTWLNDNVLADEAERLAVLQGFIGMTPSVGKDTEQYQSYMRRMRAVVGTSAGSDGKCNNATDDTDDTYIWAHDHDNDPSTSLACGGSDNQMDDSYAPYAYDAVYAIAHALHHLIVRVGVNRIIGSELMDALIYNVSFVGVTGYIDFHDASAHPDKLYHGDRRVGIAYDVFNYVDNEKALVRIGKWTPLETSTFQQRWISYDDVTFSTADNTKPNDFVKVRDHSTMFLIIIVVLSALIVIIGARLTIKFVRNVLTLRRKEESRKNAKCLSAVHAVVTMNSPAYVMSYKSFKESGMLILHEEARRTGVLVSIDNYADLLDFTNRFKVIFFSHQWLASSEPDPNRIQYKEMCSAAEQIREAENADPSELYIFLDIISIPQKNLRQRQCAIETLGCFASIFPYFVIIAPKAFHANTNQECNLETYARRGWCRLEQWGHLCTYEYQGMFAYYDGNLVPLQKLGSNWIEESILVFEGDYSVPESKGELVDTVLGLYAMTVRLTSTSSSELHQLILKHSSRVFPKEFFEDLPVRINRIVLKASSEDAALLSTSINELTKRRKEATRNRNQSTTKLFAAVEV